MKNFIAKKLKEFKDEGVLVDFTIKNRLYEPPTYCVEYMKDGEKKTLYLRNPDEAFGFIWGVEV